MLGRKGAESMYFDQFYLACLAHASYMIGSEGIAAVIDPQRDVEIYIEEARKQGLRDSAHDRNASCTPISFPGTASSRLAPARRFTWAKRPARSILTTT